MFKKKKNIDERQEKEFYKAEHYLAIEMFELKEEDLIDDLNGVLTVGDFYQRAEGEGTQIIFI